MAIQTSRQQVVSKSRQSSVRTYAILKELEEFFSGKKTSKVQEQREMGNRLSAAGASRQGWAPSPEGPCIDASGAAALSHSVPRAALLNGLHTRAG